MSSSEENHSEENRSGEDRSNENRSNENRSNENRSDENLTPKAIKTKSMKAVKKSGCKNKRIYSCWFELRPACKIYKEETRNILGTKFYIVKVCGWK